MIGIEKICIELLHDKLNNQIEKLTARIDQLTTRIDFLENLNVGDTNTQPKKTNTGIKMHTQLDNLNLQGQDQEDFYAPYKSDVTIPDFKPPQFSGGFGGGHFNPLDQGHQEEESYIPDSLVDSVDYNFRPEKDLELDNAIYIYENAKDATIDKDDLDGVLDRFYPDTDMDTARETFTKKLENLSNATRSLFTTREPGIHKNNVTIDGNNVTLCYSKVSNQKHDTSYNMLYN